MTNDYGLTPEQSAAIVEKWIMPFFNDDETIGDLTLLLRAIVYAVEQGERENMLIAIEKVLMPMTTTASDALDKLVLMRRKLVKR